MFTITLYTTYIIHYTINVHYILCRDDRVEPLDPPADSKPGDRVFVDGYQDEMAGGMCSIYWILHDVSDLSMFRVR